MYTVEPLFKLGKVPALEHCEIQQIEKQKDGKYRYAIRNNYNPWGSGWADEDWIVEQISKAQKCSLNGA